MKLSHEELIQLAHEPSYARGPIHGPAHGRSPGYDSGSIVPARYTVPSGIKVIERHDQVMMVSPGRGDWIKLSRDAWSAVRQGVTGGYPGTEPYAKLFAHLIAGGYIAITTEDAGPCGAGPCGAGPCGPVPCGPGSQATGFHGATGPAGVGAPECPPLKRVYLNITDRCNLACSTCYFSARPAAGEDPLDLAGWCRIIDRLSVENPGSVVISGGEPLVRKDIIALIDHIRPRFKEVVLLTNGTLVDMAVAQRLSRNDITVQVSIEGDSGDAHDLVRGQGSFVAAMCGVRSLAGAGVNKVELVPTLTRTNLAHLWGFSEFAAAEGVGYHFSLFMPVGRGRCRSRDLALSPQDLIRYVTGMVEQEIQVAIGTQAAGIECPAESPLQTGVKTSCGAGESVMSIGPDGSIYPCPLLHMPALRFGNALTDSVQGVRRKMQGLMPGVDDLPGCGRCSVRYFCGGGCRAASYLERGDFLSCDPYCEFYRCLFEAFVWEWREDRTVQQNLHRLKEYLGAYH